MSKGQTNKTTLKKKNISLVFSPPPSLTLHPHAHFSPSMSILRRLHLNLCTTTRRRRLATASAALRQDTTVWTPAPLSKVEHAAESLFHIAIDVSDAPDHAASHTLAGQYLQLRLPDALKPSFLAIASPPKLAAARGVFFGFSSFVGFVNLLVVLIC